MNREKQIDEMALVICKSKNPNIEKDCPKCVFNCMCDIQDGCQALFDKGYRLASEVAREIIDEIDKIIECCKIDEFSKETDEYIRTSYNGNLLVFLLAELKKIYTEK